MASSVRKRAAHAAHGAAGDVLSVFPTELGWIGLVGAEEGVVALSFGHETPVAVRRELQRKLALFDGHPERDWSPDLRARLEAYSAGEWSVLSDVELRLGPATKFRRAVIAAVRSIGYAETTTYGRVAQLAGFPGAARAVGQVMADNPVPLIVPCHRVLAAGGRLGGYSARSGPAMKQRLLDREQSVAAHGDAREQSRLRLIDRSAAKSWNETEAGCKRARDNSAKFARIAIRDPCAVPHGGGERYPGEQE